MGAPERGCQTPARHRHHVGLDTAGLQGRRTTGRGIRRVRPVRFGGVRPERDCPHQVRHAARTGRSGRGAPRKRDIRLPRHGDEPEDRRRLYREIHGLRGRSREPRAGDRRARRSRGVDGILLSGTRRQIFSLQMALVPLLGNRPGLRDRQTGHLPHPGRRQEVERRRRRRERELRFPDLQRRGFRPSRGGRRNETLGHMDFPDAQCGRHAPRRAQTHQECVHRRLHAQRPGFAGQGVLRRRRVLER